MLDVLVPLGDAIFLIVGPFHGKFPDAFSFLIDTDPVTIVDTGFSPEVATWLRDTYRPARVINTHSHIDHCRQNVIFEGCEIWVPEMTADTFGVVDLLAPRFCDEPLAADNWSR
ncbi:MAG: MBL fold metallo-hydrolase, partial [Deltaproteobacteria bacterium]|nr:MBL fold metallo-hydrolase [Deltaproteobacteria bacterium]